MFSRSGYSHAISAEIGNIDQRLRALERGRPFSVGRGDLDAAVRVHLRLADRSLRAARGADALEHYRAARVLLEV